MISTYSMGLYYGLGWTLIESYYRPYGRAFLKGRLTWLEPWMLYLVWGALLLGLNPVAAGLLIGLGLVNASLGKERDEINPEINEALIVEFYNKML